MKTFLAGFVLEEETQRLLHRPRTGSARASRGQAAVSVGLSLRVGPHAATLHTDVLAKGVGGSLTNPSWKVIWPKSYFLLFFNPSDIFPKTLWSWRFCNPWSPLQGVLILTPYNARSITVSEAWVKFQL